MMLRRPLATDLRLTMRSWSTAAALVFVVALATLFSLAAYSTMSAQVRGEPPTPAGFAGAAAAAAAQPPTLSTIIAAERGVSLTFALLFFLLVASCLAAGVRAATTIVGEKERQTYDLLWTTRLTTASFLWTKFLGVLAFAILVMAMVAPVFGLAAVYNGPPWQSVAAALVLILAAVSASAATGLLFSAVASSTLSASLLTVLAIFGGLTVAAVLYELAASYGLGSAWQVVLFASPPAALLSAVVADFHTPLMLLLPAVVRASPEHPVHVAWRLQNPFPLWAVTSVLLLALTVLLLSSATACVTVSSARSPLGRRSYRSWKLATRVAGKAE